MQIKKNFPYIIVLQGTERLTLRNLISTENFTSALLYLFGAYYSFNYGRIPEGLTVITFGRSQAGGRGIT